MSRWLFFSFCMPLLVACRAADPQPIASGFASPLAIGGPVGTSPSSGAIVFVPDASGVNDYGPNALALAGLRSEGQRLGLAEPAVIPAGDSSQPVVQLPNPAKLVIGQGSGLADTFVSAAKSHPGVMFVLIDSPDRPGTPNLRTISFNLKDGADAAGRLAAGVSQGHIVAFAGGKETDESRQLAASFGAGASGARVITAYTGSDDNQADAKRLAEGLISDRGADVLFAAADPAGLGTIAAASQHRVLAIGINRDDNDVAPNAVLSSVIKRTDIAAAQALDQFSQGWLTGGHDVLNVASGGVGLAPAHELAERVPAALAQELGLGR